MDELKNMIREVMKENAEIIHEDHDILVEIRVQFAAFISTQKDHENRIRKIERILSYGFGAVGALKLIWDLLQTRLVR